MAEILAVIPARGGSKGIPRKNLALLGGKPLIAYTIEAARGAKELGRVVVSTDSEEIAVEARKLGAEVPFLRPAELARDDTPGMPPLLHALRWMEEHEDRQFDYLMCLQPTSPFRTAEDIVAAIELALAKDADGVVSVCQVEQHPYWMKGLTDDGRLEPFIPQAGTAAARRQDLPKVYALNGAIYLGRRDVLLEQQTWYTPRTYGYIMPRERSLDIDTPWDLHVADLIMKDRRAHEQH